MIVEEDNWLAVDFGDWSPAMMGLAYVLSRLPVRPGTPEELIHSYPIGIERLRANCGDQALDRLCDVAEDLEWRPDHREVVRLGRTMTRTRCELALVVSQGEAHRGRDRTARLRLGPRAGG